jgi:hypothetical protein
MRGIVIYAVRDPQFLQYATQAARSAKRYMPSIPITLFTDLPDCPYIKPRRFDSIVPLSPVQEKECHNQMVALKNSPYDTLICLGADSWVCDSLFEIFEALEDDRIDLMVPMTGRSFIHAPLAHLGMQWIFEEHGIPDLFPYYATGGLSMVKNKRTDAFLQKWIAHYNRILPIWPAPICPTQWSLRVALYQSPNLQVVPLRPCYDYALHGYFRQTIKIMQWQADERELRRLEGNANRQPNTPRFLCHGECIGTP